MKKQIFKLNENEEFIPLDKLLKIMRLVNSGGEAHSLITEGMIKVNNETELQKRKKIRVGDIVIFDNQQIEITK
ncbi:MAG: RNA-binding S4 domain-containing protein [Moheibacter sp.]